MYRVYFYVLNKRFERIFDTLTEAIHFIEVHVENGGSCVIEHC